MNLLKTPTFRLSFTLVLLTVNLLFAAEMTGFIPDRSESELEVRKTLSESLALQFTSMADSGRFNAIQNTVRMVVERNKDIRSAAIRTESGKLVALAGEHLAHWEKLSDGKSTPTHVQVPVFRRGKKWANVEIRFASLWENRLAKGFVGSFPGLLCFVGTGGFVAYFLVIKRTLRQLDPTTVIPERVQKAFDVLQEGVLILDEKEQIVLANQYLSSVIGRCPKELVGLKGSELGWLDMPKNDQGSSLPWLEVLKDGVENKSAALRLGDSLGVKRKLSVNASKICSPSGKCRGSLVTFSDITELEEKNFELHDLVDKLHSSREEIKAKSDELEFLANRDPMTQCFNRRALDRNLEALFSSAKREAKDLSCLMADIDFFKSVNDKYGHQTGDEVIKAVAEVLKECTRDSDFVGRYGGEEFCVVLPGLKQELAIQIAERVRKGIERRHCGGVKVTASFGVSSLEQNPNKAEDLVNQADKALYAAKKGGRNRVVSWGQEKECEIKSEVPQEGGGSQEKDLKKDPEHLLRRIQELEGQLQKKALEFEHHEMYDGLTGLPTRTLFEDRISREIARNKRNANDFFFVVMSITLDTINRVYETQGDKAAKQLLKACGERLNEILRDDIDTVAMINDNEESSSLYLFNQTEMGILLTNFRQIDHVAWVIKRLQDAFEEPFDVLGHKIFASIYVGVSIFPTDGKNAEDLYRSAVSACHHVQTTNGSSRYMFASEKINAKADRQLQMESCLREAIENNELELHYQPQIEATTGRVAGFEALLRWNSPELGNVSPLELVSIAEHSGQINCIGDWVLHTACKELRGWIDAGVDVGTIAVNLSGAQLRQRNLPYRIMEMVSEFKLDWDSLEIELTESSLVNCYENSFTVLRQIHEFGFALSIDDFGTGYSSFSYLKNIPLSCVKIDRSFVSDIAKDEKSEKLIASMVTMAHVLGFSVVAEGVEDQYQAEFLTELGCERLQGYHFSRPIPAREVAGFVKNNPGKNGTFCSNKGFKELPGADMVL